MFHEIVKFVCELVNPPVREGLLDLTQVISEDEITEEPVYSDETTRISCPNNSWGALYPLPYPNYQFENIYLVEHSVVLGRRDFNYRDKEISSSHLKFLFDAPSGKCNVLDSSLNGTYLNGFKLQSGLAVPIKTGDKISLAVQEGRCESVVFVFYRIKDHYVLKIPDLNDSAMTLLDPVIKVDVIYNDLLCKICKNLIHNPVAFFPCGHSFCGTCIENRHIVDTRKCPICHSNVESMSRNHILGLLVSTYYHMAGEQREPVSREADNKIDDMLDRFANLSNWRRRNWIHQKAKRSFHTIEPSMGIRVRCQRCPGRNSQNTDTCMPDTVHYICQYCQEPFPQQPKNTKNTCFFCKNKFCGEVFDCKGVDFKYGFGPIAKVFPIRPPYSWAWGNEIESNTIQLAIRDSGLDLQNIYDRILLFLYRRDVFWEQSRLFEMGASLSTYSCRDCVSDVVFPELLFLCRRLFKAHEVDPRPRHLVDCPGGRDCRLQKISLDHCMKFNHYCLPNPYVDLPST